MCKRKHSVKQECLFGTYAFHTTKLSNRNIYFHVIQKILHARQAIRSSCLADKLGRSTRDLSIKATTFRKHAVSLRSGYTYCPNTEQNSSYTTREDGRRIHFGNSVILHKELGRWTKFK